VDFDKVATGSYFVDMRSVGIKVLKNKLSEYVRLAASGETVLVTDRDRVVAELGPPRGSVGQPTAEARWAELIEQGIVTPAKRRGPLPRGEPVMSLEELMAELDKDREDR
jgi:antitoxin (DNA-binding transcriptional repressor) of toxin-antitoxin stability system